MRKILFLDIDGVLNPKWWEMKPFVDAYGFAFDSKCVSNLAKVLDETGAEIVISSSWKCIGLAKLKKMWKDRKMPGMIIDVTPDYQESKLWQDMDYLYNRGCEIKE